MNKKYTAYIVGVIVLVVIGAAIFGSSARPADSYRTLGMSLALTGPNASIGERVKNGAMLALDQYNSLHSDSENMNAIIEDDQSDAKSAVSAFKKLVDVDKVSAAIGFLRSDQTLAIAELANTSKVVALSPTAGADEVTTAGDYIFRNIETGEAHGKGAAEFLQTKNVNTAYILIGNAANAKTYSAHFKTNAEKAGIEIKGESSYEAKQTDYRTQALKVVAAHPEALYIGVTTAPDAGLIVKQLRTLGFKGIVMMSVAADGKEFFDAVGSNAGETYVTGSPLAASAAGQAFISRYKELYGKTPDGFAANGYDAMNILIIAVDACQKEGAISDRAAMRTCIKDNLYKVKGYDGAGGITTFDSNGDVIKEIQVKKAVNGAFEVVL